MENHLILNKQLCFALHDTTNEFTRVYSHVLKPFGLTYPQYLILLCLWEQDGIPMKELGQKLNMGIGTLNPIITRMQNNEWLLKTRSTNDERIVLVTLQEKAHQKKEEIIQNKKNGRAEEKKSREYPALF